LPARGLAVTPVDAPLLDAVARLVSLLDSPQDIGPCARSPRRAHRRSGSQEPSAG
jgi:hypothetical protein